MTCTQTHQRSRCVTRVCLFGLSADPPTGYGGHVGIVQALLSDPQQTWDYIGILPVYRHTYAVRLFVCVCVYIYMFVCLFGEQCADGG